MTAPGERLDRFRISRLTREHNHRYAEQRRMGHAASGEGRSPMSSPIDMDSPGGAASRAKTHDANGAGGGSAAVHKIALATGSSSIPDGGGGIAWTSAAGDPAGRQGFAQAAQELAGGPVTAVPFDRTGPVEMSLQVEWDSHRATGDYVLVRTRGGATATYPLPQGPVPRSRFFDDDTPLLVDIQAGDTLTVRAPNDSGGAASVAARLQLAQIVTIGAPTFSVTPPGVVDQLYMDALVHSFRTGPGPVASNATLDAGASYTLLVTGHWTHSSTFPTPRGTLHWSLDGGSADWDDNSTDHPPDDGGPVGVGNTDTEAVYWITGQGHVGHFGTDDEPIGDNAGGLDIAILSGHLSLADAKTAVS